ncbi:MAG: aldo/keto reductase [Pseudomonadota bacterium]
MKPVLGTMTFGEQADRATSARMLELFAEAGGREIDTANVYCDGRSESFLGNILQGQIRPFTASKVHPWNDHGLQPEQIKHQLNQSLQRLQVDSIDLLYLHSPDLDTPIRKTLSTCYELFQQGKFKTFGLSNYAAWQVAEIAEICHREGWMQPTVYQGMYNALTRDVERELMPCLRNYGLCFYAYNPLAGGLLTGKYQSEQDLPDDGRFGLNQAYQQRYWKSEYFEVLQNLDKACREASVKPVEVAMSWLHNHSLLDAAKGDGVIIGASKISQLEENLQYLAPKPLEASILKILDEGWNLIKPDCASYFRP